MKTREEDGKDGSISIIFPVDLEGSTMMMETSNMKDYAGRGSVADLECHITQMGS